MGAGGDSSTQDVSPACNTQGREAEAREQQHRKKAKKQRHISKEASAHNHSTASSQPADAQKASIEERIKQHGTGESSMDLENALQDRDIVKDGKELQPLQLHVRIACITDESVRLGEVVGIHSHRVKDAYNVKFDDNGKVTRNLILRLVDKPGRRKYGVYGVNWTVISKESSCQPGDSVRRKRVLKKVLGAKVREVGKGLSKADKATGQLLRKIASRVGITTLSKQRANKIATQLNASAKKNWKSSEGKLAGIAREIDELRGRSMAPSELHGREPENEAGPGHSKGTVWNWKGDSRAERLNLAVPEKKIDAERHVICYDCDRLAAQFPSKPYLEFLSTRCEVAFTASRFCPMRGIDNEVLPNIVVDKPQVLSFDFRAAGTNAHEVCKILNEVCPNSDFIPWKTQGKKRDLTVDGGSHRLPVTALKHLVANIPSLDKIGVYVFGQKADVTTHENIMSCSELAFMETGDTDFGNGQGMSTCLIDMSASLDVSDLFEGVPGAEGKCIPCFTPGHGRVPGAGHVPGWFVHPIHLAKQVGEKFTEGLEFGTVQAVPPNKSFEGNEYVPRGQRCFVLNEESRKGLKKVPAFSAILYHPKLKHFLVDKLYKKLDPYKLDNENIDTASLNRKLGAILELVDDMEKWTEESTREEMMTMRLELKFKAFVRNGTIPYLRDCVEAWIEARIIEALGRCGIPACNMKAILELFRHFARFFRDTTRHGTHTATIVRALCLILNAMGFSLPNINRAVEKFKASGMTLESMIRQGLEYEQLRKSPISLVDKKLEAKRLIFAHMLGSILKKGKLYLYHKHGGMLSAFEMGYVDRKGKPILDDEGKPFVGYRTIDELVDGFVFPPKNKPSWQVVARQPWKLHYAMTQAGNEETKLQAEKNDVVFFDKVLPTALSPVLQSSFVKPNSRFLSLLTNQDDLGHYGEKVLDSTLKEADHQYRCLMEFDGGSDAGSDEDDGDVDQQDDM
jgi:hypothetical protein